LQAGEPRSSTPTATVVEKPSAVSKRAVYLTEVFSITYKRHRRIRGFSPGTLCKIAKFFLDCSGYLDDLAAFQ
jgi:hypothetical protein